MLTSANKSVKIAYSKKGGDFMNFQENDSLKNVLEKYGRDITKNVADNKVDPVIGRDE